MVTYKDFFVMLCSKTKTFWIWIFFSGFLIKRYNCSLSMHCRFFLKIFFCLEIYLEK
eukprot:05448.XXX_312697_312867_1 [CDS] Oithona nana genome sequencing.